eukprot:gene39458-48038_t
MKAIFFAFVLVCVFSWAFAEIEVSEAKLQLFADFRDAGVAKVNKWLESQGVKPEDRITEENLRSEPAVETAAVEVAAAAGPTFAYVAQYSGAAVGDCSGTIDMMVSLRFESCEAMNGRYSMKIVYSGVVEGKHVMDVMSYNNRNCRGQPVFMDNFARFPMGCMGGLMATIGDTLPHVEHLTPGGVLATVSSNKAACDTELAGGMTVPQQFVKEMTYLPLGVCSGKRFNECTRGDPTASSSPSSFQYRNKCGTDEPVANTRTSDSFCRRRSETFGGTGYGHMNWLCNMPA